MSRGRVSAFGATTRFAPRLRNSRASRSSTSSATLSVAVATAMPVASAAPARILRRGLSRNDRLTRRRNTGLSPRGRQARPEERLQIDYQIAGVQSRGKADRVAAPRLPDRGDVDRRAAVPADHVRPLLVIAGGAADLAGVQGGGGG